MNCTEYTYTFVYSVSNDYEFTYTLESNYVHQYEVETDYNFCVDKDNLPKGIGIWTIGSTFKVS